MAPGRLRLNRDVLRLVAAHLDSCTPEEGCGLLSGRDERVERVWPIENIAHSRVRYFMEPRQLVQAVLTIEDDREELLGAYHSHPAGPEGVSNTDVDEWQYPDSALLVWSPGGGGWAARGFVIEPGVVREIPIEIDRDA